MRCPDCGTATWYGDRCLAGHSRPGSAPPAKTKVRTPATARTKDLAEPETTPETAKSGPVSADS